MNTLKTPRLVIAGTGSGCGKTTLTCAILSALKRRGIKTAAFKCGPDYIDTMFHSAVIGDSNNIDSFIMPKSSIFSIISDNCADADIALIEGVMGYYDGINGTETAGTAEIADIIKAPVVLILNISGIALSAAAIINGFLNFRNNNIKAVILNNVKPAMFEYYKNIIETNTDTKVIGFMPYNLDNEFKNRHLGLITASEIADINLKLKRLSSDAEKNINLDELIKIASLAPPVNCNSQLNIGKICTNTKIAVAYDRAFCFYYNANIKLLESLGAEIYFFSPLANERLAPDTKGIYIGGGYPELYLEQLEKNTDVIKDILHYTDKGIPLFAECGGFMYMHSYIINEKRKYKMVGLIHGEIELTNHLVDFGYVTMTAKNDGMFCKKGFKINAHEFHYSKSNNPGNDFEAEKPMNRKKRNCIHMYDNIFCGYPHIHFYGNQEIAKNFLRAASNIQL